MKNFKKKQLAILLAAVLLLAALPAWSGGAKEAPAGEATGETAEAVTTKFKEAPMLAELVKQGKLPNVDERIPENPFVREVHSEIGKYGGTIRMFGLSIDWAAGQVRPNWNGDWGGIAFSIPFDVNTWIAEGLHLGELRNFYAESYWHNADYTEATLTLRKGVKWSDGAPLTAEDIVWNYNAINIHPEVNPIPRWFAMAGAGIMKVEKVDDRTVRLTTDIPHPAGLMWVVAEGTRPKHWLSQFHPDENSSATWEDLQEHMNIQLHPEQPQLGAFILEEVNEMEGYALSTRNPFYPAVDSAGNQLPYVDHIKCVVVSSPELGVLSAVQGELDVQGRHYNLGNYQTLKEGEQRGNYKVRLWKGGARQGYIACEVEPLDQKIAPYIRQVNFRRALSLGINRERINDTLYFGLAETGATLVAPDSVFFRPEMDTYADYDPARARKMLEELGLKDTDDDGILEYPEGGKVSVIFDVSTDVNPIQVNQGELLVADWRAIGLDVTMNAQGINVIAGRTTAGEAPLISFWSPSLEPYLPHAFLGRQYSPTAFLEGHGLKNPPQEFKDMWELEQKLSAELDPKKFMELVTEFYTREGRDVLYQIAITNAFPIPIVVSNKMGNVPETGVSQRGAASAHFDQFYFK